MILKTVKNTGKCKSYCSFRYELCILGANLKTSQWWSHLPTKFSSSNTPNTSIGHPKVSRRRHLRSPARHQNFVLRGGRHLVPSPLSPPFPHFFPIPYAMRQRPECLHSSHPEVSFQLIESRGEVVKIFFFFWKWIFLKSKYYTLDTITYNSFESEFKKNREKTFFSNFVNWNVMNWNQIFLEISEFFSNLEMILGIPIKSWFFSKNLDFQKNFFWIRKFFFRSYFLIHTFFLIFKNFRTIFFGKKLMSIKGLRYAN